MSTSDAKRMAPVLVDDVAEPLVPLPGKSLRGWLLAALIVWQVLVLWFVPSATFITPIFHDPIPIGAGEFITLAPSFDEYRLMEIIAGVSFAVSANLAFLMTKLPGPQLSRGFLGVSLFAAAMIGVLASFTYDQVDVAMGQVAIICVIEFLFGVVLFTLAPGLRRKMLRPLEEGATFGARAGRQFRLLHLFYVMSVAGILLALVRFIPFSIDWENTLHEPVEFFLVVLVAAATHLLQALLVFGIGFANHRGVWLLFGVGLLSPLLAFVAAVLIAGITGNQPGSEVYETMQKMYLMSFCFLAGTALAVRLLGYRLVLV